MKGISPIYLLPHASPPAHFASFLMLLLLLLL
jgi:hypothetical protein